VSRASLHNADEVRRKDLRPGDRVRVARAGDVIPQVEERVTEADAGGRAEPFAMPERCPACATSVVREGAYFLCPAGLACPPQVEGRIMHYASRNAMDIDQLGEKTVQQLVDRGLVRNLADLYHLGREDLLELDGFAEKSAIQLHDSIQGANEADLGRFLYALGIPHAGRKVSAQLAESFGSLDALEAADREALAAVPGIGPEIADSVAHFFADPTNRKVLRGLREAGVRVRETVAPDRRPLAGKTFVFTGSLDGSSREEARERVERLGARAASSVSGNTDYLVLGADPGSKLDQAREAGVAILEEDEFERLVADAESGG
ncbi:MAG TPA: helix-hairpin-helix domain-containing protein, partial [Gammaproteobacteria bacterium]|nr:helix-hairpin-helix domain-containing protein [Gammaproteobacteria bacterium]